LQYNAAKVRIGPGVVESLNNIRNSIKEDLTKYTLNGNQNAVSEVSSGAQMIPFKTHKNMHSEMKAIEHKLLNREWILRDGVIRTAAGERVSINDFKTDKKYPHCGFCTLFMQVLELPLSYPTAGNGNLVKQDITAFIYPLPDAIRNSKEVFINLIDRIAGRSDGQRFRKIISLFFSKDDEWYLIDDATNWAWTSAGPTSDYETLEEKGMFALRLSEAWGNKEKRDAMWKFLFEQMKESNRLFEQNFSINEKRRKNSYKPLFQDP
jgi:hypothetical protein